MSANTQPGWDGYSLGRDVDATARLNYQYFLWQDTIGYHVSPEILPRLPPKPRICEVATGSGIWILDALKQFDDSATFVGLDIDLEQAPHKALLPANVSFQHWNFLEPPPAELMGTFDLVHIRLIGIAIRKNDPSREIDNVRMLLKPGGYLQWEEHYTADLKSYPGTPSPSTPEDWTGLKDMERLLGGPIHATSGQVLLDNRQWIETVHNTLAEHGFEDVKRTILPDRPAMGRFWMEVYLMTVTEFVRKVASTDEKLAGWLQDMASRANRAKSLGGWVENPKIVLLAKNKT